MKHSIASTPKRFIVALALVACTSLQASAQQNVFAYAAPVVKTRSTVNPEESNMMIKRGCRIEVQQEAASQLRFLVKVENPSHDKLILVIKDSQNNALHKEVLDTDETSFIGRYNLDKLEDGNYIFEVRNGRNKLEKSIDIKTQLQVSRVVSVD